MISVRHSRFLLVTVGTSLAIVFATAACAETPYEADQRRQLEQYQKTHPVSPQVAQAQRWEREWREQHPNEPMPSFAKLEKMHQAELLANNKLAGQRMWAAHNAELKRNHDWARESQRKQLAAKHITWTPQQWRQWENRYDEEQKQRARDYVKAFGEMGENARLEAQRDEEERRRKQQ
jgi:hypothetical protein